MVKARHVVATVRTASIPRVVVPGHGKRPVHLLAETRNGNGPLCAAGLTFDPVVPTSRYLARLCYLLHLSTIVWHRAFVLRFLFSYLYYFHEYYLNEIIILKQHLLSL